MVGFFFDQFIELLLFFFLFFVSLYDSIFFCVLCDQLLVGPSSQEEGGGAAIPDALGFGGFSLSILVVDSDVVGAEAEFIVEGVFTLDG